MFTTMVLTESEKQQWVRKYAERIIGLWQKQHPHFPIDQNYTQHLTDQLDEFFDDNLKKELIETTY
jgi:hypothetical protein